MPVCTISKTPTSSVAPKRFLVVLKSLKVPNFSPSKYKTVSTICSKVFGPATEPSLVTCPTKKTEKPVLLAIFNNLEVDSLTWPIEPALPLNSSVVKV